MCSLQRNIHRSQGRSLFSIRLGLQSCFLWSLALFQGHAALLAPAFRSSHLPPAHEAKNLLSPAWPTPTCFAILLRLSFILCHKISQETTCDSSVSVDLFFLIWFLHSSTLTVLDLGSFQRRKWGWRQGACLQLVESNTVISLHCYILQAYPVCVDVAESPPSHSLPVLVWHLFYTGDLKLLLTGF